MKQIVRFSLFIGVVILMPNCKKYDDGGFYLCSKRNLLSHDGKWSIEKFIVNGEDSTDYVVSNNDPNIRKDFFRVFFTESRYYVQVNNDINLMRYLFVLDKNEVLIAGRYNSVATYDFLPSGVKVRTVLTPRGESEEWRVNKLTSRKIELNSLDGKYSLVLNSNK